MGAAPHADAPRDPRDVAFDVARRAARTGRLSRTLGRALDHSGLHGRDRSAVTDLAYGEARWRRWLDAALAPHLGRPDALPPDVRTLLRLGTFDRLKRGTPAHAATSTWVDVARRRTPRFAKLVNAVLRRVAPPEAPSPALAASLPDATYARLVAALGDDRAATAAAAMRTPGPTWLAVLAPDADAALARDGADVAPGPVPGTRRVRPAGRLGDLEAFRRGLVQPMNPASTLVAHALQAPTGARVLDLASGRGIKAAVLAAGGARVEAVERDPGKLAAAQRNLARLGRRTDARAADLLAPDVAADLARDPAPYVLLDAPCSGSGTLRGHPEIADRFDVADLPALADAQRRLLHVAADATAAGGTLVYATCSLFAEEGPDVVAQVLHARGDLTPDPPPFATLAPDVPLHPAAVGTFTLPADGLDGFYVARLRRTATP
ncbi:MAG: RsmB/NOP family class I SAM-dependent RNA methyltransferase [Trueperaceae bacterium]|nr:RsmB/NOP family class I SAM-dependent RNA methyltransferase [Trueperaceae bacterium]